MNFLVCWLYKKEASFSCYKAAAPWWMVDGGIKEPLQALLPPRPVSQGNTTDSTRFVAVSVGYTSGFPYW